MENLTTVSLDPSLEALLEAKGIITSARQSVSVDATFSWDFLYDAGRHIEKQIAAHFKQEAA